MERALRAVFLRLRPRPRLLIAGTVLWAVGAAISVTLIATAVAALATGMSTATSLKVALIANLVALTGIAVAVVVSLPLLRPVVDWVFERQPRPDVAEVLERTLRIPVALTARGILIVSLLHLAVTVPYITWGAELPVHVGYPAVALFVQIAVFFAWALLVFALEFALRPLVEEIDAHVDPDADRPQVGWALATRILVPIPAVAAFAGATTGAIVYRFASTASDALLAASLVAMAAALLLTPLVKTAISDPLVRPILDLKAATERVARGDFDSPVTVTSADELGALGTAFNRMQTGLEERELLRSHNEELLDEVRASRARIIAASDAERRRVEHNIHDGAQQRLVALALELRMLEAKAGARGEGEIEEAAASASDNLSSALGELRELARGLHPQILSTDGLRPALEQLAGRASVPVTVEAPTERYTDSVESTAYFVVSEALANVGKYAQASAAEVSVDQRNGALHVEVADDGVGGADPDSGSGLSGLSDRVAALDGRLAVESEAGGGTRVRAELPLREDGEA